MMQSPGRARSRMRCAILLPAALSLLLCTAAEARPYTLSKSRTTGWWFWECKDGSGSGWASTKGDAKDDARAACGSLAYNLTHPEGLGPILTADGYLGCNAVTLEGATVLHSADAIGVAACGNHFGLEPDEGVILDPVDAVKGSLLLWGIYRGGITRDEVQSVHDLEVHDFHLIETQSFAEGSWVDVEPAYLRWYLVQ